ncbi:MAG: M20/M25/M40 family metallo-hydrolase, partial [Candidatus Acidiferrum sp.]
VFVSLKLAARKDEVRRTIVRKHVSALAIAVIFLAVLPLAAQAPNQAELSAIHQIKDIGFNHSEIMDTISYLSDVYGPRLTNSPDIKEAANWTTEQMKKWQLANVNLERWGPFGRGWSNERTSVQVISPRPFPLIAYAKAWTPGTNGPVTADAVFAPITKEEDFAKFKGQLKGKFVLTAPVPESPERFEPQTHRYTDAELADLASQPVPGAGNDLEERIAQFRARRDFQLKVQKFLVEEGVAVWVEPSRGDDGTVFVQQGGDRDKTKDPAPCRVAVASENYGRIVRMLDKKVTVTMFADIQNKFYDDDLNSFNIVGEIPGSDKSKADEVVMLGGHFDSWQSGTGATDNGAGSAVMLEAIRILKTSGLKMRRTVRIALWTGEEEGLLGSRAYIKQHFGDPNTDDPSTHLIKILPEHAKLDAYYNIDNGTGKIRGVYLQGNEMIAPIFNAWMVPFHDLGMTTLSIRNTGGTDHLSFDAVGLPGFQFIQDPLDYETRTHHSNMDTYERIQESDMKQMAVIVASFVYLTANRDEMMPRKPLPKPVPVRNF